MIENPFRCLLVIAFSLGLLVCNLTSLLAQESAKTETARGIVFDDTNRNGQLDDLEPRIAGIKVSNGREIVTTDQNGKYEVPISNDGIVFVIKPQGWATPLNENNLPQFYYIHKPEGSPSTFRYKGVEPTGPLPESIDFPLHRQDEPDEFRAILFGDPQPKNQKEVDYIAHDVVEELIGSDASFGVTLGDIAFDNLLTFDSLNEAIALIGIPWYNVIGNHDLNYEAANDEQSDETFERVYGPSYYSFDYGQVHFIVVDNVEWIVKTEGERGTYRGGIGTRQIEFINKDLSLIPEGQMVVLLMHVPVTNVADKAGLFRLIEDRPFCISISGHTHHHEHKFLKKADGWQGAEPHHHIVNVTVSGSWWNGALDERGLPHAQMADGAPNGYSILSFDGKRYKLDYKAAGRDANHQMQLFAPPTVIAHRIAETTVYANIFNASELATVEMRLGTGEWVAMEKTLENDPAYEAIFKREQSLSDKTSGDLPKPKPSTHLWKANLGGDVEAGTTVIEVRAVEPENEQRLGQTYSGKRIIRIIQTARNN
jgi:hypothetical protein